MRFKAIALLLSLVAVALYGVTFGEPDGNAHPFVGTLIFEQPGGLFSCSGTMLSSTVMLTAGHCTKGGGIVNPKTWVKFDPAISFPGRQNYPSLAAFLDDPANGWTKGQAIPHPQFDDFAQFPLTYDVGVIVLEKRLSWASTEHYRRKVFWRGSGTRAGIAITGLRWPVMECRV